MNSFLWRKGRTIQRYKDNNFELTSNLMNEWKSNQLKIETKLN